MRRLFCCATAIASLACIAAAPADDCANSAIYPTGCDQPPPAVQQIAAPVDVGAIATPTRARAIHCLDPATLQSILAQEQRNPSTDLDALQSYLVPDGCSMSDTGLSWRVIGTAGRYAQAQLIAGPSLIMWFDRADLAAPPTDAQAERD